MINIFKKIITESITLAVNEEVSKLYNKKEITSFFYCGKEYKMILNPLLKEIRND